MHVPDTCYVYVMVNPDGWCKIGVSENPKRRKANIGGEITIWSQYKFGKDSYRIESAAHCVMELRGHRRRYCDWFKSSPLACARAVMAAKRAIDCGDEAKIKDMARAKRKRVGPHKCKECRTVIGYDPHYLDSNGDHYVCYTCWSKHMGF